MGASSCYCGKKEQELAAGSRSHELAPMGRSYAPKEVPLGDRGYATCQPC